MILAFALGFGVAVLVLGLAARRRPASRTPYLDRLIARGQGHLSLNEAQGNWTAGYMLDDHKFVFGDQTLTTTVRPLYGDQDHT